MPNSDMERTIIIVRKVLETHPINIQEKQEHLHPSKNPIV